MSRQQHSVVTAKVEIEVSRRGWRVFRNNVGRAWHGNVTEEYMMSTKNGSKKVIELYDAYMISYGLGVGSSDRVGWRPVVITPEMVGQTIAQFVALECKSARYTRVPEEQWNFLQQVHRAGGYAAVARLIDEELILEEVGG